MLKPYHYSRYQETRRWYLCCTAHCLRIFVGLVFHFSCCGCDYTLPSFLGCILAWPACNRGCIYMGVSFRCFVCPADWSGFCLGGDIGLGGLFSQSFSVDIVQSFKHERFICCTPLVHLPCVHICTTFLLVSYGVQLQRARKVISHLSKGPRQTTGSCATLGCVWQRLFPKAK
jgi:hypothetical protein